MKGGGLHWTLLLLLSLVVAKSSSSPSPSPRPCDSRCVCYDDPSSNLRAANCSTVRYDGHSFSQLLKDVQILRLHDGNGDGGVFSKSWSSCPNLEELYVSDNRQASLSYRTFKNCKKLRVLDVSHNKISKVHQIDWLLKELPLMERLVLKGNPIGALPDLASPSLTFLDLSYCSLSILGHGTFAKLKKLHTLNLEGNSLKKFKSELPGSLRVLNLVLNDIATLSPVERFSKLRVLELAGNPLECSCELVRLRNQGTGDLVSSAQEVTCAGPKSLRGLRWSQARKHCDQDQLKRRSRRDVDDLEEEGSGYDPDTDTVEENADADDDEVDAFGDNLIEEDDQDSETDADPIEAPAEEETESPDSDDTKLVDSKLLGTVEEPDESAKEDVGNSFFETDHSTSSTTEHEFIVHEAKIDDDDGEAKQDETEPKVDVDAAVSGNDETEDTAGSEKQADNVEKEEEGDGADDDDAVDSEVKADEEETETESSFNYDIAGSENENLNKENENEEDGGNEEEDGTGSEGESLNKENEKEEETDNKEEEKEDVTGLEDEILNKVIEKEEDSDDKEEGVTGSEDEIVYKDSEEERDDDNEQLGSHLWMEDKVLNMDSEEEEDDDNKEEEDVTGSEDDIVNKETEKEQGSDNEEEEGITGSEDENVNKESEKEEDGDHKEEDSVGAYDGTASEDGNNNESGKEEEADNEQDYVTGSEDEDVTEESVSSTYHNGGHIFEDPKTGEYYDDEDDSYGPVENVVHNEVAAEVESGVEDDSESKTEASLDVAGFEGSGSDSEDAESVLTPVTKDVTVGHVAHKERGRKLDLGERTGQEGEASQGTTEAGPEVTPAGTEVTPAGTEATPAGTEVPVVAPESEDTSETVSLESPESPVTSTGSYVVLGLIMVLIVFLLGYAVYKSRLGRRRSDSDSRTIKEKDVELGKGNDRELQDVSKPLLVTPPAAAVNGKSELHQPLVSKPTENPQLKDDAEDKKKESPLPSRYHIYETLNGDKERIEVPPPATAAAAATPPPAAADNNGDATIPVTSSPKKSQSPTRVVSKVPSPRDGPNMYGNGDDNDDDDGEVFLKNNQQNGDLGSPRSCRVTVVQGDLSVPKKPVFVVNPGAPASNGVV